MAMGMQVKLVLPGCKTVVHHYVSSRNNIVSALPPVSSPKPSKALAFKWNKLVIVPLTSAAFIPLTSDVAQAVTAEEVAENLNKVQGYSEQVTSTVISTYEFVSGTVQNVLTFIKPALDVVLPVLQKTTDSALKAAAPVAKDVASQAFKSLETAGLDTKPVLEAGQTAVTVAGQAAEQTGTLIQDAKPVVSTVLDSLLKSDPLIIAGEAGLALVVYLLAPGILSSIGEAVRGYKGDLTAPQALDFVSAGKYTLIDVRGEKDKSKSGLPSVPNNAKRNVISIPIEELPGKLRSQVRNARSTEAEVAAVKISALKKVNRGSKIVILDSIGGTAKLVAKSLCALGFKNTWIVLDGFDGNKGWVKNKLGTEPYNLSFAEILNPSRILSPRTIMKTVSSKSSDVVDVPSRSNKLLPSGYED